MIQILEVISFTISAAALIYGLCRINRKNAALYFRFYVCAAGCYTLEELWVMVNSLLGTGGETGLVTVRLFGIFGCLCFMLSANANDFDKIVDEGSSKKAKKLALLAPALLLALFAAFVLSHLSYYSVFEILCATLCLAPGLFLSYYSLKHLLMPEDSMNYLSGIKNIDILVLIFCTANFTYPLAYAFFSAVFMGVYDALMACILFGIVISCRKGAEKWNTLI